MRLGEGGGGGREKRERERGKLEEGMGVDWEFRESVSVCVRELNGSKSLPANPPQRRLAGPPTVLGEPGLRGYV